MCKFSQSVSMLVVRVETIFMKRFMVLWFENGFLWFLVSISKNLKNEMFLTQNENLTMVFSVPMVQKWL